MSASSSVAAAGQSSAEVSAYPVGWLPALASQHVAEPDGPPIGVRILGERFVAFRDTSGVVGVLDEYCPHRRASLVQGRNENNSLACIYHGWRLTTTGKVLDCPGEKSPKIFASRVNHRGLAVREADGLIWVWFGDPDLAPPFEPTGNPEPVGVV